MSEGRPRRSAASASSKAWAGLMPNAQHKEDLLSEDFAEANKTPSKRGADSTASAARGRRPVKKPRTSEGEGAELPKSPPSAPHVQPVLSVQHEIKTPTRQVKKIPVASPVKQQIITISKPSQLPVPPVNVNNIAIPNDHEMQLMAQEFDRHNTSLHAEVDALEEEEEPERKTPNAPVQRNRPRVPMKQPSSTLVNQDDPSDPDFVDDSPQERGVRTVRKRPPPQQKRLPVQVSAPQPVQPPRNPVLRQAVPRAPLVVRPAPQGRVFVPRVPTVINGGPRVVQPRFASQQQQQQRIVNTNVLKQVPQTQTYETPINVTRSIEKYTDDLKDVDAPELRSAFDLIELLRAEMERMHSYIRDTNSYYVGLIEDVQVSAQSQYEQCQNRIRTLESHNLNLEGQLKKASAIAHQKTIKTVLESIQSRPAGGHLDQPGPSKIVQVPQQHYVVVEGEPAPVEQQPSDYLVQTDDYNQPGYYSAHDAAIQEASKALDNIM